MYRNQWIPLTRLASDFVGIVMAPVICQPSMKVACDGIAFVAITYAVKIHCDFLLKNSSRTCVDL